MHFNVRFHDPELQRTVDKLEANRANPKFVAARKAEIREARRAYWTSLPFAVVVIVSVIPAISLAALHLAFGTEIGPLQWALLMGMPALSFWVTYPR